MNIYSSNKAFSLICFSIMLCLCLSEAIFAQSGELVQDEQAELKVPNVMSYEGYITDNDGQPIADGQYDFTFSLYTTPEGGTPVWMEEHHSVTVSNGFVQLYLGRGTPHNPLDLPFDRQYFLGIRIGNNQEMIPRLEFTSTGYSFRAKIADEVPDGSITSDKLAPRSVTDEKIESVGWSKITDIPQNLSSGPNEKPLGPGGVPANVWSMFGNSKTDSTTDILGTTDFQALVMKTDNMERLRIKATGEINIAGDLRVGDDLEVVDNAKIGDSLDVFGITTLHNTTESTTKNNGALIVAGGVGIAKRINVGGDGLFESDLDVDGITHLNNTTESTSSSNGALVVAGGTGIGKRLNVGSDLGVAQNGFFGGRVGIGAAAPSGLKLSVSGQGSYAGNHIALFENTGTTSPDGIAIKVSTGTPNNQNNFITFLDGTSTTRGRIEGQTAVDVVTSPEYIFFTFLDGFELGLAIADQIAAAASANVCAGVGAVACPPIASLIAGAAVKIGAQVARVAATQAFLFDNLGVTYQSGSGDYAEYLERMKVAEEIEAGDIVGIVGGKISKSTKGAQQIMSVSISPIVLGNAPPEGEEYRYEKVAFMGQVPVKVLGAVNSGDYIIPSGREDGTGIAVSPEMMTADEFAEVVGRAWGSSQDEFLKMVNVVVGLNSGDIATMIRKQQLANQSLKAQLDALKADITVLKSMEQKMVRLEAAFDQLLKNGDREYALKQ